MIDNKKELPSGRLLFCVCNARFVDTDTLFDDADVIYGGKVVKNGGALII